MNDDCNIYYAINLNQNFNRKIIFNNINDVWMIEIDVGEKGRIKFNREMFPELKEDDFTNKFIEILEKSFQIKFEKKQVDYVD